MPAPKPKDPLDDPIARFVNEVNAYLAMKRDVAPPPKHDTGNPWDDLQRNWDELKRHIRRCYEALVGAAPEITERVQAIISVGNEIKALTDDPYILNPVEGVVARAVDEHNEMGNVMTRMASATSFPAVMSLFAELLGFGGRTVVRRNEVNDMLNDLTAYYLLRPEPPASA